MADLSPLKVMTLDSVDKLRAEVAFGKAEYIWNLDFNKLDEEFELEYIDVGYKVDLTVSINPPTEEGISSKENDAINSKLILESLPTLTPADARDEGLWVTLALKYLKNYVVERWPLNKVKPAKHFKNHVFASSSRNFVRDQAISRLWWSGYYIRKIDSERLSENLKVLFDDSDLSVGLLGRPNIATVTSLGKIILNKYREHFIDEGIPYNRDKFRSILKKIDLLAGRAALGTLSEATIEQLVEELFFEEILELLDS